MEEKPNDIDLIDVDEFDEAEANSNKEPDPKKPDGTQKTEEELEKEKEELKAKNAKFAEMRREKEAKEKAEQAAREAKIRKEAAEQAELGMLKTNPYTEEPINDADDLEVYKIQRKLEEEGKDPVKDLPKRLAELNRKHKSEVAAEEQKRLEADKERSTKVAEENRELREKYPDLNTAELAQDPLFKECMHGRVGRWKLVEIYELYLSKKKAKEAQEEEERIKKAADGKSNPPSSNASGQKISKNVADMTPEEFKEYWRNKYGE